MNYLAHLQLAPRQADAILGALLGDFRRHVDLSQLPPSIMLGVVHHRAVDKFTDSHPLIADMKSLFSRERRRYAGIIIDISFDHFLSRHWRRFNTDGREEFIRYAHGCLRQGQALLPPRMRQLLGYLIAEDWLGSYAELAGVADSLDRLARRLRFRNQLHGAIEEVHSNYLALERGFLEFYPQLQAHMRPSSGSALVTETRREPAFHLV